MPRSTKALCARVTAAVAAGLLLLATLTIVAATPAAAATTSWEKSFTGWNRTSTPAVADLDGDGNAEIIVGHQDGKLRAYRADGSLMWSASAAVSGAAAAIDSSPAVADIDGDGRPEIVVGVGSTWKANQHGGVVVFNHDGSVLWRHQTRDEFTVWGMGPNRDGYSEGVYATPSIGDVDGDGRLDVVIASWDFRIYAFRGDGSVIPGFPYYNDDTIWSSPALYDVDGDGRMEIFFGGDSTAGGVEDWNGGVFRALDWRSNSVVELWKRRSYEVIDSSAAIGDIDGDGKPEVVVGNGDFYEPSNGDHRKVWAWNLEDGSTVSGWPKTTGGIVWSSPALADLTGDGRPEVIAAGRDGKVTAWRGTGAQLWSVSLPDGFDGAHTGNNTSDFSPVTADVNGDGIDDVIVGNVVGLWVLDGRNGAILSELGRWRSYVGSATVAKIGGTWRLYVNAIDTPSSTSWLTALNLTVTGSPDWPTWRRDLRRRGAPNSDGTPLPPGYCARGSNPTPAPSASSARGYWFLGGDGRVYAFSAPHKGDLVSRGVGARAVSLRPAVDGEGYWILAEGGRVEAFGSAGFHGDLRGVALNAAVIALAPTADGKGYWLLAADGGVFSFGSARFHGSTGNMVLNAPVISMAVTRTGSGYWLLAADGGVFTFGDARFFGSTGNLRLNAPVIAMSPNPKGPGYWLFGSDGGVFSFSVPFYGSIPGIGLCNPPAGRVLRASRTGAGYWILGGDGGVFTFGDAKFFGAQPGLTGASAAIDLAVRA